MRAKVQGSAKTQKVQSRTALNLFVFQTGYQVCRNLSSVDVRFEIFNGLANRLNFLGLLVRNRYIEFFFKFHD